MSKVVLKVYAKHYGLAFSVLFDKKTGLENVIVNKGLTSTLSHDGYRFEARREEVRVIEGWFGRWKLIHHFHDDSVGYTREIIAVIGEHTSNKILIQLCNNSDDFWIECIDDSIAVELIEKKYDYTNEKYCGVVTD